MSKKQKRVSALAKMMAEMGFSSTKTRRGYETFMVKVMMREPRSRIYSDGHMIYASSEIIQEYELCEVV